MKKHIKKIGLALREARKILEETVFFSTALDIIVFTFICLLVTRLLTIEFWYAFIPVPFYALFHFKRASRNINLRTIEEKTPLLDEELRTAADNWRKNNEVVKALNQDVLSKMQNIKTSDYIDLSKVTRQLVVIAILSFVIIGTSAFDIHFLDLRETIDDLKNFKPAGLYVLDNELLELEESHDLSDILGDEEILELGNEQINLELNPNKFDIDISQVKNPSQRSFSRELPSNIRAKAGGNYRDEIPKQYQRIVKNYFRGITRF